MRWVPAILVLLNSISAWAQLDSTYRPGHTHSWKSKALISRLKEQLQSELKRNNLAIESPTGKQYVEITNGLRRLVQDSVLLDHVEIQSLLDSTFLRLKEANPGLLPTPKTILAYRSPLPNAFCAGEGSLLVSTGLLSRIQNQSQLAAVLAHELAHYELNHVRKGMELDVVLNPKIGTRPSRSETSDRTVDAILGLRNRATYFYQVHRKWELEADSLGFIYFTKAGFRQPEFITMFAVLDPEGTTVEQPPSVFFAPLNTSRYPFKEEWLRPRATIYSKSRAEFFLPEDALRSHPEMVARAEKLLPYIRNEGKLNLVPEDRIWNISTAVTLESVAVGSRSYLDLAMHEVLWGLRKYPGNKYLVTAMGRLLLRSATIMNDGLLDYYLPMITSGYDGQMLLVNNFMNNISGRELVELGFNFMNKKENFRSDVEEHYYLLYSFCKLSNRKETMSILKAEYKSLFPKGRYAKAMR